MKEEVLTRLERQVSRLLGSLERMNLEEYLKYLGDCRRLFRVNFWAGVARGLGTMVGFTILGAAALALLGHIVVDNVPLIGDFLAEVVKVAMERR